MLHRMIGCSTNSGSRCWSRSVWAKSLSMTCGAVAPNNHQIRHRSKPNEWASMGVKWLGDKPSIQQSSVLLNRPELRRGSVQLERSQTRRRITRTRWPLSVVICQWSCPAHTRPVSERSWESGALGQHKPCFYWACVMMDLRSREANLELMARDILERVPEDHRRG